MGLTLHQVADVCSFSYDDKRTGWACSQKKVSLRVESQGLRILSVVQRLWEQMKRFFGWTDRIGNSAVLLGRIKWTYFAFARGYFDQPPHRSLLYQKADSSGEQSLRETLSKFYMNKTPSAQKRVFTLLKAQKIVSSIYQTKHEKVQPGFWVRDTVQRLPPQPSDAPFGSHALDYLAIKGSTALSQKGLRKLFSVFSNTLVGVTDPTLQLNLLSLYKSDLQYRFDEKQNKEIQKLLLRQASFSVDLSLDLLSEKKREEAKAALNVAEAYLPFVSDQTLHDRVSCWKTLLTFSTTSLLQLTSLSDGAKALLCQTTVFLHFPYHRLFSILSHDDKGVLLWSLFESFYNNPFANSFALLLQMVPWAPNPSKTFLDKTTAFIKQKIETTSNQPQFDFLLDLVDQMYDRFSETQQIDIQEALEKRGRAMLADIQQALSSKRPKEWTRAEDLLQNTLLPRLSLMTKNDDLLIQALSWQQLLFYNQHLNQNLGSIEKQRGSYHTISQLNLHPSLIQEVGKGLLDLSKQLLSPNSTLFTPERRVDLFWIVCIALSKQKKCPLSKEIQQAIQEKMDACPLLSEKYGKQKL